jgi:hypothetical protein
MRQMGAPTACLSVCEHARMISGSWVSRRARYGGRTLLSSQANRCYQLASQSFDLRSRRSSTYWAMSIQQRRASFVRRKQTGRQTKKLVEPRSTNRWHSVAVAALGSVAASWKECAAQCNPRRDHSREVLENGKVPHAKQEPSRMGNGRQVRNAGAGSRRPPRAGTLCTLAGCVDHAGEKMRAFQLS